MDWLALVQTVGFPTAVAAFVLFRLNGKLDRVAVELQLLRVELQRARGVGPGGA